MIGGPVGQCGGLLVRARLPQAVQQPGHRARVVEGGVGGPVGQCGGLSAAAAGGALWYRASSSGAPARNWITSPSRADLAASTIRTSAARASWPICAGVNAAGTVMSCPASSSRAWACRSSSSSSAGRPVRAAQNPGHTVASTSTGARAGSRSSSRSPAATRSPSPASAGSR